MDRCLFCQGNLVLEPTGLICLQCGRTQSKLGLGAGMQDDKQSPSILCPACGEFLPVGARFCGKCGQTLLTPIRGQTTSPLGDKPTLHSQEQSDRVQEAPLPVTTPGGQGVKTQQKHLFISYSRKQFYFAESLALTLQRRRVPVWFDVQYLVPGSDWQQSLQEGLNSCAGLVLIASQAALNSAYVRSEWQTALLAGKPIYVVLFEAVRLPPELANALIFDFRSNFNRAVATLVETIQTGKTHRDRLPWVNPLRFPTLLPLSLWVVMGALWSNTFASAASIILIKWMFPGISILNLRGEELVILLAFMSFGLLFIFCFYALMLTYRRSHFSYLEMRFFLLGSPLALILYATLLFTLQNFFSSNPFSFLLAGLDVTVAPDADQFASGFLLITLLLLVLGVCAFFVMPRSNAIVRWLPAGTVPEKLRTQGNTFLSTGLPWKTRSSSKVRTYRFHYNPADEHIAIEIRQALRGEGRLRESSGNQADIHLIILTNHTSQAWVSDLAQSLSNVIYIVASSIRIPKDEMSLRRSQWVDYRLRFEHMKLAHLLCEDPATTGEYLYPAIPESLEKLVFPQRMLWISNAILMMGTYALGGSVALILLSFIKLTQLDIFPIFGLFTGSLFFWLDGRLKNWNITYAGFLVALGIALIGLFLSGVFQVIFPMRTVERAIVTLIGLLVVLSISHKVLRRWLPKRGHHLFKRRKLTLIAPTWKQLWRVRVIYLWFMVLLVLLVLVNSTLASSVAP